MSAAVRASWVLIMVAAAVSASALPMTAQRFFGTEFRVADSPVWDGDPTPYSEGPKVLLINPGNDVVVEFLFEDPTVASFSWPVLAGTVELVALPSRLSSQSNKTCSPPSSCPRWIASGVTESPAFTLRLEPILSAPGGTFAAALLNPGGNAHRSDMTFLIPTCLLGTEHRVASYINKPPPGATCARPSNSADSWIMIVGHEAGTAVTITDDTGSTTIHSGTTLGAGDYFLWNNGSDPTLADVTGFRVVTSKKAAVYSGSDCTAIGLPAIDCNSLIEAVMPTSVYEDTGTAYVALPSRVRPVGTGPCTGTDCTPDVFRFVADAHLRLRTNPSIAGCDNVELQAGEFAECRSSAPFLVHSHDPATDAWPGAVFRGFQYLVSADALWAVPSPTAPPAIRSALIGDPAMATVMPVSTWACRATFTIPPGFDRHDVHVVRVAGDDLQMSVNGGAFADVASTCETLSTAFSFHGLSLCVQHVEITEAPGATIELHSLSGPMTVMATGFGDYDAYAWNVPGHEEDNASPYTVACPADATYECGTTHSPGAATVNFRCGPWGSLTPDVTVSPVAGTPVDRPVEDCPIVSETHWTLTVVDACLPQVSCEHVAEAVDTTAPTLSSVTSPLTADCASVPAAPTVTASDSCEGALTPSLATVRTDGPCADTYTLTRTWTASDSCGNAATPVQQVVNVSDGTPPTLVGVPADTTADCASVPPAASVTATDDCDPAPGVVLSETTIPGSCPSSYTLRRRWTATDRCGNSVFDEQDITVTDTTPPVVGPGTNLSDEACLKQANHKYFCYENLSTLWAIEDACCEQTTLAVGCVSGEPENGTGDGSTVDDCVYDDDNDVLCVRAERKGNRRNPDNSRPGRTYTVNVTATDCCGNASAPTRVFRVYVPHDSSMNPVSEEGIPLSCEKPKDSSCCEVGTP